MADFSAENEAVGGDVLDAALDFAARGWPVFPCSPEHKRPLIARDRDATGAPIPKTGGVAKATTDAAQIRAWWTKWPAALIGVATGHDNLFVLDFDPRADEDGEVYTLPRLRADLEAMMGCALPPSLTSVTQSGGVHVWLRWADAGAPITNRGNLPRHVDVRGRGGYVIAPPSMMASGRGYRWLRGLGPDACAIAPAPAALLTILRDKAGGGAVPATTAPRSAPASDDPVEAARRKWAWGALDAMIREAGALQSGQRNAGISAIGCRLGAIVGAGYLSETTVRAELERVARLWPDLPKTMASIDSAVRTGMASPRDMSDIGTRAGGGGWSAGAAERRAAPPDPSRENTPRPPRDGAEKPKVPARKAEGFDEQSAARRAHLMAMTRVWVTRKMGARAGMTEQEQGRFAFALGLRAGAGMTGGREKILSRWVRRFAPERLCALTRDFDAGAARPFDVGPMLLLLRGAERPMTDLGNAERFRDRAGDDLRFTTAKGWLSWDGRRWAMMDQDDKSAPAAVQAAVFDTVRAIQDEARAVAATGRPGADNPHGLDRVWVEGKQLVCLSQKLAEWGRASESAGRLGCLAGLVKRWVTVPIEQFDCDPFAINVRNGTLRFSRVRDDAGRWRASVVLEPHRREDLNTRLAPVEYDRQAGAPNYDRFFAWAQPAPDMRRYLHQWAGYSMSGDVGEQKLQFWYGLGGNGKSVTQDLWAHVVGDYAGSIGIETFLDQGIKKRGDNASPDLARLGGVRMLRASEPERGAKLNEALIKAVTGGEPMAVRALHRGFFDLRPQFKLTVGGNYRPEIPGTDEGIWRRMKLIPWDQSISDADRDEELPAKLRAEADGVFLRLVDGLIDWMENGLVEPDAVTVATAQYREDSDPLARFLNTCTAVDPSARVQSSRLFDVYAAWCKVAGEREWSPKGFSKAMLDKGLTKKPSNGVQWLGIRLVKSVDDFLDHEGRVRRDLDDGASAPATGASVPPLPPPDDDFVPDF